ncbi:F-box and associated interaction domain protein [Medicago truncatula]|uniref:F-box and associated interaction domain protein n=1 Tax=Medicago truncatula TaxID=3880 RepID=G7JZZ5_MEDTR|nr:F-box and associated interaction domain protein [Medicago truncatula]
MRDRRHTQFRIGGEDVKTVVSTPSVVETTTSNPLRFLPEELIVKILLSLPVRSLLRFKRVCKTWKTLISDTQFANNRFLISTAYPQLVAAQNQEIKSYPIESLLQNSSTTVTPVSFNTGHQDYIIILGSCNGFLCLHNVHQHSVRL